MKPHHWSGWPGAFCLDCGASDANEEALANDPDFDPFVEPLEDRNGPCAADPRTDGLCGQCEALT